MSSIGSIFHFLGMNKAPSEGVRTGSNVQQATQPPPLPQESFSANYDRLRLLSSEGELSFPTNGAVFEVGRDLKCPVHFDDRSVSRHHAYGCFKDGQLYIQDNNSSFHTFVDGQQIEPGKWAPVGQGSELRLGELTMVLGQARPHAFLQPGDNEPVTMIMPRYNPAQQAGQAAGLQAAAAAVGHPAVGVALARVSLDDLARQANGPLPSIQEMTKATVQTASTMAQTSGVVDLTNGLPTLVITDIHGRRDYIMRALQAKSPDTGERVWDMLQQGKINVVCMGDGMHGEGRVAGRWKEIDAGAFQDLAESHQLGKRSLPLLDQEMTESLGVMKMVMDLKTSFPENFHYIRGNHDEVKGQFYKYARGLGEAGLARQWMEQRMGKDFVEKYAQFEDSMPLVVKGNGFVASHSAPNRAYQRSEIESRNEEVTKGLTWTENSVRDDAGNYLWETRENHANLEATKESLGAQGSVWLLGHRPVRPDEHGGRYRSQFNGELVQLNAPDNNVVAFLRPTEHLNPERDVFWV